MRQLHFPFDAYRELADWQVERRDGMPVKMLTDEDVEAIHKQLDREQNPQLPRKPR